MLLKFKSKNSNIHPKHEQELNLQKCKSTVISRIVSEMFDDKEHYQYYSEILIDFITSFDTTSPLAENIAKTNNTNCFVDKDNEHVNILKQEFSL